MYKASIKTGFLFALIVFVLAPLSADAQYGGRGGSAYKSKINKLDDDTVDEISIPILFGITLRSITSNFGDPRDGGSRSHEGLDIMAPKGAPIVSPTEAVVIRTGNGSGSGKYVSTANPGGETFVYMHLDEILVRNGQELEEGDIIGYVGNTGNASGGAPHLHLEIRDGRKATDPFPRIDKEYALKEKIEFLEKAIKDVDDEDDLIEFVVNNYQTDLRAAIAAGIEVPDDVLDELRTALVTSASVRSTPSAAGDLERGATGPLVVTLQEFLIAKATGPEAGILEASGATGYFGPVTERALIEYQKAKGITPAVGYFGPKTRAVMLADA